MRGSRRLNRRRRAELRARATRIHQTFSNRELIAWLLDSFSMIAMLICVWGLALISADPERGPVDLWVQVFFMKAVFGVLAARAFDVAMTPPGWIAVGLAPGYLMVVAFFTVCGGYNAYDWECDRFEYVTYAERRAFSDRATLEDALGFGEPCPEASDLDVLASD